MNFKWTKEYYSYDWDTWGDEDFERYGLTKQEIVYAWALNEAYEDIFDDINKYVLSGAQEYWQVNDEIIKVINNKVIISNPHKEPEYELSYSLFKEHVAIILEAKQNAS